MNVHSDYTKSNFVNFDYYYTLNRKIIDVILLIADENEVIIMNISVNAPTTI